MGWALWCWGGFGIRVFGFGAVDCVLNKAPPTGLKRKLHLTAGLHPRLLTCRLPTASLIGTEPTGLIFWGVDFCGFASGPDGDRGEIYWIIRMGRMGWVF